MFGHLKERGRGEHFSHPAADFATDFPPQEYATRRRGVFQSCGVLSVQAPTYFGLDRGLRPLAPASDE
jgi:hypothetical protein